MEIASAGVPFEASTLLIAPGSNMIRRVSMKSGATGFATKNGRRFSGTYSIA
jgi:hypothetical protein